MIQLIICYDDRHLQLNIPSELYGSHQVTFKNLKIDFEVPEYFRFDDI